jgi:hypothetical protein
MTQRRSSSGDTGVGATWTCLWRRLAGGLIDIVLATIAAGLISGAVYAASGSVVRMGVPAPVNSCTTAKSLSAEVVQAAAAAAPGHTPTDALGCVDRFLGLETSRHMLVAMAGADARVVFVPLSPAGEVVKPVKLGWLAPVAFILLMGLSEGWLGGTPGKFVLGLKLEGANVPRAIARNLMVHAWLLAWLATPVVSALMKPPPFVGLLPTYAFGAAALLLLIAGRPDPLYDRWTGVRIRRPG